MSTFHHHQLTEERLGKLRSDIMHQKNNKERNERRDNPALQQRNIPCFCIENNKHPKWKLCPIDMSPKLYFVNNVKNSSRKNNDAGKNVGVLSSSNQISLATSMDMFSITSLLNQQKIPSSSRKNDATSTKKNDADMTLRFRIDSANTDRRKTVHKGFFNKGFYSAPRPHHFRDDIHRPVSSLYKFKNLLINFYDIIVISKLLELPWSKSFKTIRM